MSNGQELEKTSRGPAVLEPTAGGRLILIRDPRLIENFQRRACRLQLFGSGRAGRAFLHRPQPPPPLKKKEKENPPFPPPSPPRITSIAPWSPIAHVRLPPRARPEPRRNVGMMFNLGYVRPIRGAGASRACPRSPLRSSIAPLGDAPVAPSVVLSHAVATRRCSLPKPHCAWATARCPLLGRPSCMALPAALLHGTVTSRAASGIVRTNLPRGCRTLRRCNRSRPKPFPGFGVSARPTLLSTNRPRTSASVSTV